MSAATDDPFTAPVKGEAVVGTGKHDSKARNKAYNEAVGDMKAAAPDLWETCYRDALLKRGLKYVVRLTAEERAEKEKAEAQAKAREQIEALAEKYGIAVGFAASNEDATPKG
jgi:hypothetical protein